jgi:hypothetical protein
MAKLRIQQNGFNAIPLSYKQENVYLLSNPILKTLVYNQYNNYSPLF